MHLSVCLKCVCVCVYAKTKNQTLPEINTDKIGSTLKYELMIFILFIFVIFRYDQHCWGNTLQVL